MMKALIVDDEPNSCEVLQTLLEKYHPGIYILPSCNSAHEALIAIRQQTPDVVFLDVEMPHMNGFELLEQLQDVSFNLIFTTSYDKYAIKAIRFSAMDYLLKPIDREELQQAIQKLQRTPAGNNLNEQLGLLLQKMQQPAASMRKIAMPTFEGLQLIDIAHIIYCASASNYTTLYLKQQQKLTVSRTLKEIEEMLDEYSFTRVHNSYLVNLDEITKYIRGEGGYLVMTDNSHVDVSKSRKDALLRKLQPGRTAG
ncbi:LytR/AlgR family response regulator transcription factor [Deminuibacter soli]|uniref:DNA-binding response regulator n=1 Tax=Deminuibacter soli TaxID=2291815 RepID=A0A3E1ND99_9BACT|nr:LytTR family DNA-binding domain-containing protein [Deminuibacter soli]RFM25837.1 DNA-binding response regulator [Deminuibacter soli]